MDRLTQDQIVKQLASELGVSPEDISQIGVGGFGLVYQAVSPSLNRKVAVKVINQELSESREANERFFNEAKILSRIVHPNIVRLFKFGQLPAGIPYFVMEFIDGESVAQRLRKDGRLSLSQVKLLFGDICSAIHELHSHGIIYRDISANNCIIENSAERERLKLIDLGLVKSVSPSLSGQKLTQTMKICGSLPYLSPEACFGKSLDERSDVYSLTCLLYEMLCGRTPFQSNDEKTVLQMHVSSTHVPLHEQSQDERVYPELEELVAKGLAKEPSARFQTVLELNEALQRVTRSVASNRYRRTSSQANQIANPLILLCLILILGLAAFSISSWMSSAPSSGKTSIQLMADLHLKFNEQPKSLGKQRLREAIDTIRQALKLSKQDQLLTTTQEIVCLRWLSRAYEDDEFDTCVQCLRDMQEIYLKRHKSFDNLIDDTARSVFHSAKGTGNAARAIPVLQELADNWILSGADDFKTAALLDLADLYVYCGDLDRAEAVIRKLAKRPPLDNVIFDRFCMERMTIALHRNDRTSALRYLKCIKPGSLTWYSSGNRIIRVELFANNWSDATALFSPSNTHISEEYECKYSNLDCSGIGVLLAAHERDWTLANQRFDQFAGTLVINPWFYFDYLADFDIAQYAKMLTEAGKVEEAKKVSLTGEKLRLLCLHAIEQRRVAPQTVSK